MNRTLVVGDADAAPLSSLLNAELGAGLYSEARNQQDIANPGALVLGARESGQLVGGAVSRLLGVEDAAYYHAFGEEVTPIFKIGAVGSVEAVAVAPGSRHRGLGSELLQASLTWMERHGAQAAVAVSWVSGRASSAGIFTRAGFTAGRTVPDFYLEESVRDGWTCPVCHGPCRCAGQFVYRRLGSHAGARR